MIIVVAAGEGPEMRAAPKSARIADSDSLFIARLDLIGETAAVWLGRDLSPTSMAG
jgi:hypothetical protein